MASNLSDFHFVGETVGGTAFVPAGLNLEIESNWDALGAMPSVLPFTTITGPTLDVTATTNYSADTIDNVTAITFETSAASVATFSSAQFQTNGIAANTTITGDSHADAIDVHVGAGKTFDG